MDQPTKKHDLEDRTSKFGIEIVQFCRSLKQDIVSRPLITQLVRSATSIGANYMEANGASSKQDFRNKIFICKKEAGETKYWLKMLENYYPDNKEVINSLWQECQELTLIFQKIVNTLKAKAEV